MITDKRAYNILVIEDNPGDFALVEDFLFEQIEAPKILHVETFKAAKIALTGHDVHFDVILLDLSLPDKTGEALIRDIIELSNGIPVLVLTGYTDFDFGVKSLSLGISNYILKDELTPISLYKSIIYSLERRKSILALEESEKKYSDLFNFSPLPMWVIDLETLAFLDVNQATIDHYGYTREEFLSMTLEDIRPIEEVAALFEGIEKDRVSSSSHAQRMVVHRLKNGSLRQVDIQISHIKYKGKNANVVIATDITERLAHIKEIEDQNQKMREISWMQSHVIRAPLARMMGLMDVFMLGCNDREKVIEYLRQSADELDEVIQRITDISNIKDKM